MAKKSDRLALIRDLLRRNTITNQAELLALLEIDGVETTQATLSRDLRALGVVKSDDVYALPPDGVTPTVDLSPFAAVIHEQLIKADRSGTLVVLHIRENASRQITEIIESSNLIQVVGVMGSDNTIFIATRSIGEASHLVGLIRSYQR